MPDAASAKPLPLDGIRVLDVGQVMAGPFACMLLGDLGADVIKIEPPEGGDQTRRAMGFKLKGDDSLGFLNMNRNKRSIALDLKRDADREDFLRLAETADVIVENYRPGAMKRLGIDYERVRAVNPRIIYASISGSGQSGPWSQRPGFDLIAQAASGIMSITGEAGAPPAKSGVPVTDIGCSLFAVYAILSAHIGRGKTGEGQYIDASLFDAGLAFAVWDISEYWGTGRVPTRIGTANRMAAPLSGRARRRRALRLRRQQRPPLAAPVRGHRAARPRGAPRLRDQRAAHGAPPRADRRAGDGVREPPQGRVGHPPAGARDPRRPDQRLRRGARQRARRGPRDGHGDDHPVEGRVRNIGFPVKLHGTPQRVRRHPPLLDEHRDEILAELGLAEPGLAPAGQGSDR